MRFELPATKTLELTGSKTVSVLSCVKRWLLLSRFETAQYFFTLEIAFKPGKQANIYIYIFVYLFERDKSC